MRLSLSDVGANMAPVQLNQRHRRSPVPTGPCRWTAVGIARLTDRTARAVPAVFTDLRKSCVSQEILSRRSRMIRATRAPAQLVLCAAPRTRGGNPCSDSVACNGGEVGCRSSATRGPKSLTARAPSAVSNVDARDEGFGCGRAERSERGSPRGHHCEVICAAQGHGEMGTTPGTTCAGEGDVQRVACRTHLATTMDDRSPTVGSFVRPHPAHVAWQYRTVREPGKRETETVTSDRGSCAPSLA